MDGRWQSTTQEFQTILTWRRKIALCIPLFGIMTDMGWHWAAIRYYHTNKMIKSPYIIQNHAFLHRLQDFFSISSHFVRYSFRHLAAAALRPVQTWPRSGASDRLRRFEDWEGPPRSNWNCSAPWWCHNHSPKKWCDPGRFRPVLWC